MPDPRDAPRPEPGPAPDVSGSRSGAAHGPARESPARERGPGPDEGGRPEPDDGGGPATTLRDRVLARARLGKADSLGIFGVPLLVGLTQLPPHAWRTGAPAAPGLLALLGTAGLFAAACALDDVRGYRDGSDAANYGQAADRRGTARKPLLSGRLTVGQALRFATAAWIAGGLLWAAAVAAAPARPLAALLPAAGLVVLAPQYSWGLRLSYRGFGEALMMYFSVVLVLVPPLLAGREPGAWPTAQAVLVGLWHVAVSSHANTADAAGDAATGRRTPATWLGPRANHRYLCLLAAADPAVACAVVAWSPAPVRSAVFLLPVAVLRARHAYAYHRTRDARAANLRLWLLYRYGGFALAASNIAVRAAGHPLPGLPGG